MRITQQHKLIRVANSASEKVNLNRHDMRTLLQKVMEAKTVDEKLYSLEFLFDSINKAGEIKMAKTYKFNAGDQMVWHENIYKTDKEYCAVCGKGLGENPVFVEVHNGGDLVEFGKGIQDAGYMGCWAIGSTCAHKFSPELIGKI